MTRRTHPPSTKIARVVDCLRFCFVSSVSIRSYGIRSISAAFVSISTPMTRTITTTPKLAMNHVRWRCGNNIGWTTAHDESHFRSEPRIGITRFITTNPTTTTTTPSNINSIGRRVPGYCSSSAFAVKKEPFTTTTRWFSNTSPSNNMESSGDSTSSPDRIQHIGKQEMQRILQALDQSTIKNEVNIDVEDPIRSSISDYVVVDVRTWDEVSASGPLSPNVRTLPVQVIMQHKVFEMDEDDFEDVCGFPKPNMDQTLVFTCAAGIRSVYACQFAAMAGYSKLINYTGGANEWFSSY